MSPIKAEIRDDSSHGGRVQILYRERVKAVKFIKVLVLFAICTHILAAFLSLTAQQMGHQNTRLEISLHFQNAAQSP